MHIVIITLIFVRTISKLNYITNFKGKIMKKSIYVLCLFVTIGMLLSCGDDDKKKVNIEGTYYGRYITGSSKETSLIVAKKEGSTYTLTFSDIAGVRVPPPFDVTLKESINNIWQSVAVSPYVQFMVDDNAVRITSNSGYYYTFSGKR